jgi:hypothetical protein
MRRSGIALAIASFVAVSMGCGGGQPAAAARAQVRFELEPDTARVYTEDRFVGSARVLARRPADFRTGPRQLTITADGYFPHDLEVDLPAGTTTIRVSLRPRPP